MKTDSIQTEAVRHGEGPVMVLAGPGSGKTFMLAQRVLYLIRERRVRPENILMITFTRDAAAEMRSRLKKIAGTEADSVCVGTFHSVCFRIVKEEFGSKPDLLCEAERRQIVRELIRRIMPGISDAEELSRELIREISRAKNSACAPDKYCASCCGRETFGRIFHAYDEILRQRQALDFDDMLLRCRQLFIERPNVLAERQRRFKHILTDEFQDSNALQYEILRMLAHPEDNLFVVGDDDQCIYRFRGAKPENMFEFFDDYPGARRWILGINYRCASRIVKSSSNLISHNRKRFEKSARPARDECGKVVVRYFESREEQNRAVAKKIGCLAAAGIPYGDMAVLCRTHRQAFSLIERMREENIPFFSKEKIPFIFDHPAARDILSYISIAAGVKTRANFLRIMNRPQRGLSRESLPGAKINIERWADYYAHDAVMLRTLEKLAMDIEMLCGMSPFAAVNYILYGIGYGAYVEEYIRRRGLNLTEWQSLIAEILSSARMHESFHGWFEHIKSMENELKGSVKRQREGKDADAVWVSTVHAAKGMEFEAVFIIDINEGVMPHESAESEAAIEEERRLFYVGMTRAAGELHLFCPGKEGFRELKESRFLSEIDK